jgi:hypothetical protein
MSETPEERARRLGLGGAAETVEQRAARLGLADDDTVEVEAGYPERLATTLLKGAQVIPGMKSFQAAMGSLGSKFTDNPVSYSDAKAGLEEQTDRMGAARGLAAEVVSSPVLAPVAAIRGLSGLSAAKQGALWGGASQALDINHDESLESRLIRTGAGATGGAVLGKGGSMALKLARAPKGTLRKVATDAIVPTKWQRAARSWRTATAQKPDVAKAAPKMDEGLPQLDDILVPEEAAAAAPARTIEEAVGIKDVVRNASPVKQKGATKARFDWFAEQQAKKAAERAATEAAPTLEEIPLEELLRLNLEHVKKGGSMKSASDALRLVRQK